MSGPFGFPWSTFAALLVVAGSIAVSVIWAARAGSGDGRERRGEPDDE